MIRLYIEDNEMDVTEGFSHQITYAVDDLQNLDSKATSFSKTIILPGTSKNNYLLGNIFEFSNSNFTGAGANIGYNFNASRSAKCRLEINGLQIIKGVLRLLEIVRDGDSIEYEVAIFGELGGFFATLGNKKIEDLDFSMYNHTYTIANIVNRWNADALDWIYVSPDNSTDSVLPLVVELFTNEDLTSIIKPGDTIDVTNADTNTDYGISTVSSVIYNPNEQKNVIYLLTSLTGTPANTIKVKFTILNKGGCNVYYPLIDYGNYSTDKISYQYKTFRPSLFLREYMHKIIIGAGYTYESKFFDTDFFKRLIIPHNESLLQTIKSDLFSGDFYGSYAEASVQAITIDEDILISKIYGDSFTTTDNKSWTYIATSSNVNLIGQLDIYIYTAHRAWTGSFEIRKNNVLIGSSQSISGGNGGVNVSLSINQTISLATNDILTFHIYVTKPQFFTGDVLSLTFSNNIKINSVYPITAPIQLNDNVEISKAIPKNILQKDFFASILKLFYLMVTEDKYKEKHLKIEPWTWFYDLNSDSYIDWTMKLDRSQPIRIKPMSEINSRYYELKYKSDTDYYNDLYKKRYNEGYGDVKFDNALEFAKDSQSTEVIFSSTPLVSYPSRDKIVPTIYKWNGTYGGGGFPINEERVNSNIRIMQCKTIYDIDSWSILNDTGGVAVSGYVRYPYAGHFDDPDVPGSDLNFGATKELFFSLAAGALGNNLFNTFYSSYLAEITDKDSRLVTAKFKLNDTDIFNLDFGKFIYLDGVLYRLSRIVDYTPGEICTVELLRVIYTTYDNSVNASDDPEIYINGQIWKVNNLNTSYYANGDEIPEITNAVDWENATDGAWCYYKNETPNGIIYGKLYNWFAVNDPRGLAPTGWRIPTVSDFTALGTFIGGDMYKIKESGTLHWNTNNGTNETGFTALGAGIRDDVGTFSYLKQRARFWTADEYDNDLAFYEGLNDNTSTGQGNKGDKNFGYSVRLIKDI